MLHSETDMELLAVALFIALHTLVFAAFGLSGCAKNAAVQTNPAPGKPKDKVLGSAALPPAVIADVSSGQSAEKPPAPTTQTIELAPPTLHQEVSLTPLSGNRTTKEDDLYDETSNSEPLQDVGPVL